MDLPDTLKLILTTLPKVLFLFVILIVVLPECERPLINYKIFIVCLLLSLYMSVALIVRLLLSLFASRLRLKSSKL